MSNNEPTPQDYIGLDMVADSAMLVRRYADNLAFDLSRAPPFRTVAEYNLDEAEVALMEALEKVRAARRGIEVRRAA